MRLKRFGEFEFFDEYFILQKQNESDYSKKLDINLVSLIPYRARYLEESEFRIFIQYRETGLISLVMYHFSEVAVFDEEGVISIVNAIKKEKGRLNLGIICRDLLAFIDDETDKFRFNREVVTIVDFSRHKDERQSIELIGNRLGNYNIDYRNSQDNIKAISTSYNYFATNNPPKHKRGRRTLMEGIVHAIQIAHGISHQLEVIRECGFVILNKYDIEIISLINNPFVLAKRYEGHGLFGSGLHLTIFRMASLRLGLELGIRNLFVQQIQNRELEIGDLILINYAVLKIPFHTKPRILPLHDVVTDKLSEFEEEVLHHIREHADLIYKNQLLVKAKHNHGITKNQLLKKMEEAVSGRKYLVLDVTLHKLAKLGLIHIKPFVGRGRGDDKKQYTINYNMTLFRGDLIDLIDEKFVINE